MNAALFRASLDDTAPPEGLSLALAGLWWDAKGDWARAHGCAQDQDDKQGAAVHAYLHRKEPDLANARYWYAQAGRPMPSGDFKAEWDDLLLLLLR